MPIALTRLVTSIQGPRACDARIDYRWCSTRAYEAKAFDRMPAETRAEWVIVTTVDQFHDEYICRSLEAGCHVITEKPDAQPDWFITHTQAQPIPGVPMRIELSGDVYKHVSTFPYSRLSGWHSVVYRRARLPANERSHQLDASPKVER